MSNTRRDVDYLQDITEAIERALSYTNEISWEFYLKDHKTQDAVVRNLEILGEATKRISNQLRQENPGIPWREMSGTRDRLIHDYFGVNQEIVWQIIQGNLPNLKLQIEQLIKDLQNDS